MSALYAETLKEIYRLNGIHDTFAYMKDAIEWSTFPELLKVLYRNNSDQGGRPNIFITALVKVLFLQSMFNMVDEQA